ncbi:MAG: amidohydrolase family protein [Phycisphaerales bacterium]
MTPSHRDRHRNRNRNHSRRTRAAGRLALATGLLVAIGALASSRSAATAVVVAQPAPPENGPRANPPRVHALLNARVVVKPGETIDRATVVIRDGMIESVDAAGGRAPDDARAWDLEGKTVHAGFIEPYLPVDTPDDLGSSVGRHWISTVHPELRAASLGGPSNGDATTLREMGFTTALLVPDDGIFRGQAALVALGDGDGNGNGTRTIYDADGPQVIAFARGGGPDGYPGSLMGTMAVIRQTMLDADWHAQCEDLYASNMNGFEAPEPSDAYRALRPLATGADGARALFISDNEFDFLRAAGLADEFELSNTIVRGSGNEFRRLDAIVETGHAILLPLEFPETPKVASLEDTENLSLREMMQWEQAPTNPRRLIHAGATVALTTDQLDRRTEFFGALRDAMREGLTEEQALAALTTTPAQLFGVDDRLGSIEAGKIANFVVIDGTEELFGKEREVDSVWVEGHRYEIADEPTVEPGGMYDLSIDEAFAPALPTTLKITGEATKPQVTLIVGDGDEETKAKSVDLRIDRLSFALPGKAFGRSGWERLAGVIDGDMIRGSGMTAGGDSYSWRAKRTGDVPEDEEESEEADESESDEGEGEGDAPPADPTGNDLRSGAESSVGQPARGRRSGGRRGGGGPANGNGGGGGDDDSKREPAPESYPTPLGAYGFTDGMPAPQTVLVTNATIWTAGPAGVIENGALFVRDGVIEYVGPGDAFDPPRGADDMITIDAQGKHVSPGLIDCHSHTGIDGGVNEGTQAITAEVRINDCIDPDDINWYRQVAGGLVAANQLHGSANPIGGQNSVVRLRWGGGPDDFVFDDAIAGIKFALGENVTQKNWSNRNDRYPQSRMGVETLMRSAFKAAEDYRAQWKRYEAMSDDERSRTCPPRRDLELEALVEILEGERLVHCHSYRQDEILMLLRLAEDFGFTIGTLQHILEGYKVASEIAAHGAGASSFSDWWAYKFEVYDAIPHNGALMHDVGVVVSFNSDSSELARRMNTEAAKAVRYGGVDPHEALKFVTLNPAIQLRVDDRIGSLEEGKDGDFVIWSGPPLSTFSRCEQTWIEGRPMFTLERDAELRASITTERQRLIQKVLRESLSDPDKDDAKSDDGDEASGEATPPPSRVSDDEYRRLLIEHYTNRMGRGDCGCGLDEFIEAHEHRRH